MKILVAVPSFNRPYDIIKKTGRWLTKLNVDWMVFIEPQQLIYYQSNFDRKHLQTTGTGIGVAGQMRYVKEYAIKNGYDFVFKADDDMNFKKNGTKAVDSNIVLEEFFSECEKLLENDESIGAFTIAKPIEYLHRNGVQWKQRKKTLFGNYLVRTELIDIPEGLKLSDDMIIGLNVHLSGFKMYTYQFAHEDAIAWINKGGCQSLDRFKTTEEDVAILQKKYPLITVNTNKGRADIDISMYFR